MQKATFLKNVYLDYDGGDAKRPDVSIDEWEQSVTQTLLAMRNTAPCTTSHALLDAIEREARTVTIVLEPDPQGAPPNAHAGADNTKAATRRGGKCEDDKPGELNGKGGGSDVTLTFVPKDFAEPSPGAPLLVRDEVLLHELVHALRQMRGIEDDSPDMTPPFDTIKNVSPPELEVRADGLFGPKNPKLARKPISQTYTRYEEFVSIVIANIFQSEKNRIGLVRDHLSDPTELGFPLSSPRVFLTTWKPLIARFFDEMRDVCDVIATANCFFNPVFCLYSDEDRFQPGGRIVRPR